MASAGGTYMAFDYGERRLGVAIGESVTGTARALVTLPCQGGKPHWEAMDTLLREWRPRALVVGMPRHADGTASASTRGAERLARRLGERSGLAVHVIDEHLSSREAASRLAERGLATDRGPGLDAVAAEVILESWFRSGDAA